MSEEFDVRVAEMTTTQTSTSIMFPYSYSGNSKTKEEYLQWSSFKKIEPELARRIMAMMEAAAAVGKRLGVGGSWRSSEGQERLFRSRYHEDAEGRTYWKAPDGDGPWWTKNPGVAAAAAPGKSFHETSTDGGYCMAADMIGDMVWMDANLSRFGMYNFNSELWHVQPKEIPTGRFIGRMYPRLPMILLPNDPVNPRPIISAALPTLKKGNTGNMVNMLQCQINFWQWGILKTDGQFGDQTHAGVISMQKALKQVEDGVYGPKTYQAYIEFIQYMQSLSQTNGKENNE